MKSLCCLLALLLLSTSLWAQPRERAALLPVSFLGLPAVQANFLFNSLQDQLSREFLLMSQAEVNQAYEEALNSLSGEACTEENCIAEVQASLRVQVVFSLQVLREEASDLVQITLTLQQRDRRQVRSRRCEACSLESLMEALQSASDSLLLAYQQEQQGQKAEPGLRWDPATLTLQEGKGPVRLKVGVASAVQQPVTLQLDSPDSEVLIEPRTVVIEPRNWSDWQTVMVQVPDNLELQGVRTATLRLAPSPGTLDVGYGFVDPVEVPLTLEDDDQVGVLEVLSLPPGAAVWQAGKPRVDGTGKPLQTPTTLELPAGAAPLELRLPGFRNQPVVVDVTHTQMGVRSVRLEPLPARLQVAVHPDNREGVLVINGARRLPLKGQTRSTFEAPAGTYQLQLEDAGRTSAQQTVTVRGGEEQTLQFARVGAPPKSPPQPSPPLLAPPPPRQLSWIAGISVAAYQTPGTQFPASAVSMEMPLNVTLEAQTRWGSLEGFYGTTTGTTLQEPIWLGTSQSPEPVIKVLWSQWGGRYWTPVWRFLRGTLGVAQHIWQFETSRKSYQGVQTVTEAGLGTPVAGAHWRLEPRLLADGASVRLEVALGYRL